MGEFTRMLRPAALAKLRRLAENPGENWWKDLLGFWKPSGSVAGPDGLRLAIRKNYLNFYLRGQSVARVGFTGSGEPYAETHVKFAFGPKETAQAYARLRGTEISRGGTKTELGYNGSATLHQWIANADRYRGTEKGCVDDLVANNPSIIDLEMGLPAAGDRKTAQRIDCVALEQERDVIRIVFWEAKMIDDARLRSLSEPEVICQLKIYRQYLEDIDQAKSVERAYRTVCKLLVDLHAMTAELPGRTALNPLVIEAAEANSNLKVDPIPRLVLFAGKYQKKGKWNLHQDRLNSEKIPCLLLENEPYCLSRPGKAA